MESVFIYSVERKHFYKKNFIWNLQSVWLLLRTATWKQVAGHAGIENFCRVMFFTHLFLYTALPCSKASWWRASSIHYCMTYLLQHNVKNHSKLHELSISKKYRTGKSISAEWLIHQNRPYRPILLLSVACNCCCYNWFFFPEYIFLN